jgi:hypothetical protein
MISNRALAAVLFCTLVPAAGAAPGGAPRASRAPFAIRADHGALDGLELDYLSSVADGLRGESHVTLGAMPLPGGARADLELDRVELDLSELEVVVDGRPAHLAPEAAELQLWHGTVAGSADSEVFLALSSRGTRGWIRDGAETVHVVCGPKDGEDWSRAVVRVVSEQGFAARGIASGARCELDGLASPRPRVPLGPAPQGSGGTQSLTTTTLVCRMALETDYQLFQRFNNDLAAEQTYLLALFGASNARYVEQINTALRMVYLGLHSNSNDGWTSGDTGAGSVNMLYEFQGAWQSNLPNGANLAHFLSGASLGGGVAWLDALCDPTYGFAVSGNVTLQGGLTPFPIVQGPLNWDFMVFTHETGHNFGTPHTHDFCPPLDQCAPSGYFGQCQSQQVCITNGTLMSYCHLCPSGMSGIYPYFHQACADLMRQRAEASCLAPFCTGPSNYCIAAANSVGSGAPIGASGSTSNAPNTLTLNASGLPHNVSAVFFYGSTQAQVALGNGFRCIANPLFRLGPAVNSGANGTISRALDLTVPPASSGAGAITPGTIWNFQAYYRDTAAGGANFNLTDATAIPFCP